MVNNPLIQDCHSNEPCLLAVAIFSRHDEHRTQMKLISEYVGIIQRPETDLMTVTDKQIDGSCLWLTESSSFRDWFEGPTYKDLQEHPMSDVPKYFWLTGKPGSGKSTAAGHVIKHLEDLNCDCSFYFFKYSEKGSSNIVELLRSLAYQMAYINFEIRHKILAMVQEDENFNKNDISSVWRTFFLNRIFRIDFPRPHYWVIDALDECTNPSSLFSLFSRVGKEIPLRVFITSRPLPSIHRHFLQQKIPAFEEQIRAEDSLQDIKLYLQTHAPVLPIQDQSACNDLIAQILHKCNGSFLWATLVLRELEMAHSIEQIQDVLKNVPVEMDDLYTRILDGILTLPSSVKLAKSILRWTICAIRPLKIEELKEVLRLDIDQNVPQLESVIESICGNLVYVNSQYRVHTIHQTLATFLTRQGLNSEFAIDKKKENSRIAEVCLNYLRGKELETSRIRRGKAFSGTNKRSAFVDYASLHFSEHLANSSSALDEPLILLDSFLKSNVLTWIEIIAATGDLSCLIRSAEHFRSYLNRRAKYRAPIGTEVQAVDAWANDFIRLGAAFGRSLLSSPTSIHFLTPPVCPV